MESIASGLDSKTCILTLPTPPFCQQFDVMGGGIMGPMTARYLLEFEADVPITAHAHRKTLAFL